MAELLIHNIKMLATPLGREAKRGKAMNEIFEIENAAVAVTDGIIDYVGKAENAPQSENVINAQGALVTPGLVDCHTHLVFGGWRQDEMELKLNNVPYLDILKKGGGILSTVDETRKASFETLYEKAKCFSEAMLYHGTTAFEAKSGYGLNFKDEVKQLEVIKKLKQEVHEDIAATFLGAHAVPREFQGQAEAYINYLSEEVLPYIREHNLADYCDIFCETGVFNARLSEKLLMKAKEIGFKIKIHADEIDPIGGGELAGRLQAHSAEHLIAATDAGIRLMSDAKTIAVLLPATSFYLDKPFARARKMIDEDMAVAIASDFNPGSSPNFNLQFCMNLGCFKYKLTPKEILTAVTLNAAAAMGKSNILGTLEKGKKADIIIWKAPDLNYLFYRYGNNQVKSVIKHGNLINPLATNC